MASYTLKKIIISNISKYHSGNHYTLWKWNMNNMTIDHPLQMLDFHGFSGSPWKWWFSQRLKPHWPSMYLYTYTYIYICIVYNIYIYISSTFPTFVSWLGVFARSYHSWWPWRRFASLATSSLCQVSATGRALETAIAMAWELLGLSPWSLYDHSKVLFFLFIGGYRGLKVIIGD